GDVNAWFIEVSFVARSVTYITILGLNVLVVLLALEYLGACEGQRTSDGVTKAYPLKPEKTKKFTHGTNEEDAESGKCSSSENLYERKICVICYNAQRNSFLVP
ncbi:hypothetical protein IFM89_029240, partial [Coptis chinensis]